MSYIVIVILSLITFIIYHCNSHSFATCPCVSALFLCIYIINVTKMLAVKNEFINTQKALDRIIDTYPSPAYFSPRPSPRILSRQLRQQWHSPEAYLKVLIYSFYIWEWTSSAFYLLQHRKEEREEKFLKLN